MTAPEWAVEKAMEPTRRAMSAFGFDPCLLDARRIARAALDAVWPEMTTEQQKRERVAAEIEAWVAEQEGDVLTQGAWSDGVRYGAHTAATIAREVPL